MCPWRRRVKRLDAVAAVASMRPEVEGPVLRHSSKKATRPMSKEMRFVPTQICMKRPRELQRLLRKHAGETGIVVHGWFPRARIWGPPEWMNVPVDVHGGAGDLLSQTGNRTVWLPTAPGRSLIRAGVSVDGEQLSPETHEVSLDIRPGEVALFVFATPRPSLSGRFDKPVWCEPVLVRQLGAT